MRTDYLPWSRAWQQAAVGPDGFYRQHAPHDHFETNVMHSDGTAERLHAATVVALEALADTHRRLTVTDFGAADGRLLSQLRHRLPSTLAARITWRAVDVRPRPTYLPAHIAYLHGEARRIADELEPSPGVVIAHELLDDIPCDIVEIDDEGRRRLVLVDPSNGHEVLGPDLADDDACARVGVQARHLREWCDLWWPRRAPAARVEIGRARDEAWRSITSTVREGMAVAVDYGHVRDERVTGRWDGGTLTGYRAGRVVRPVPDGTSNITAHVAMDSCAAAAAGGAELTTTPDGMHWLVQRMGR